MTSNTKVTAILLSYLRPDNIQRIFDALAASEHISKVIVSNNNPDIDLREYLKDHPKLSLRQQIVHYPPWIRFEFAVHDDAEYFISVDDDLFLTTEQVDSLIQSLFNNPSSPHGVWGQRIVKTNIGLQVRDNIFGEDGRVDVLNRAYACTKEHAINSFTLLKHLGINHARKIGMFEDVLLSFSSPDKPIIHNLGELADCNSSADPRKALHLKPGFFGLRQQIVLDIITIKGNIPWFSPERCDPTETIPHYRKKVDFT
ncbi:hypothetical protein [Hahella ganghwensis]|uniref:hypothetical protein n=1 Tax=Hahella ganghwensis TaxID=286420 RepID=UPI00035E6313|nr:hypothetical protein [Hahella ganghwensis]